MVAGKLSTVMLAGSALALSALPAAASMPVLSQQPRPATLRACQVWAEKQDEDAIDMWGIQEDVGSSREVALSRLTSVCMGGQTPEIVGFGSSVGFDEAYCARHRGTRICANVGSSSSTKPQVCTVDDPTPTPLNYRTAPYGRVLGSFGNGVRVSVIDLTKDEHGKSWAYVSDADGRPLGWVYRTTSIVIDNHSRLLETMIFRRR